MIEQERARLGLDQPIYVQFFKWFGGMLQGDFGDSMWTGRPVTYEIAIRLELSLQVAIMATILAVLLEVPLGTLSAIFKDTWIDHVDPRDLDRGARGAVVLARHDHHPAAAHLLPVDPAAHLHAVLREPVENLSQLIWPALAVGYRYSAVATRMMRSSILEVLQEDYIRTARAKGVYERLVVRATPCATRCCRW